MRSNLSHVFGLKFIPAAVIKAVVAEKGNRKEYTLGPTVKKE